jgi:hypothetical protein
MAAEKAMEILDTVSIEVTPGDEGMLKKIAMTAMTGKSVGGQRDFLADLAVKAIKMVAEKKGSKYDVDVDNIKVEKKTGGSIADSEMIKGIIVDKERVHPRSQIFKRQDASHRAPEIKDRGRGSDPDPGRSAFDEGQRQHSGQAVVSANVVFCQKGIETRSTFTKRNIYARRLKDPHGEALTQ